MLPRIAEATFERVAADAEGLADRLAAGESWDGKPIRLPSPPPS